MFKTQWIEKKRALQNYVFQTKEDWHGENLYFSEELNNFVRLYIYSMSL